MSTYKLFYFDLRLHGELSRFVFAQAGVEYEDVRIESMDWREMKTFEDKEDDEPVLEVGGDRRISGRVIIPRYLAERFGLAGENELENAQIASIVDTITDLNHGVVNLLRTDFFEDCERKEEIRKKFLEETILPKLIFFEKSASTNENGWLYNGKLTWADLSFYLSATWLLRAVPEAFEPYPGLQRLYASVESLPNIANWIEERPDNTF